MASEKPPESSGIFDHLIIMINSYMFFIETVEKYPDIYDATIDQGQEGLAISDSSVTDAQDQITEWFSGLGYIV